MPCLTHCSHNKFFDMMPFNGKGNFFATQIYKNLACFVLIILYYIFKKQVSSKSLHNFHIILFFEIECFNDAIKTNEKSVL